MAVRSPRLSLEQDKLDAHTVVGAPMKIQLLLFVNSLTSVIWIFDLIYPQGMSVTLNLENPSASEPLKGQNAGAQTIRPYPGMRPPIWRPKLLNEQSPRPNNPSVRLS
jgi:hypothetical protein